MTNYEQLLPRERGWLSYFEVWANEDHLLHIRSTRFAEDYQRFRWKDIQTISVTEFPHGTGTQWMIVIAAGFLSLAGLLIPTAWGWRVFFGLPALLGLVLGVRDLVRGPKCRFVVQTAAGSEVLAAVRRMRMAQRFLPIARARITEAQGPVESDFPSPSAWPQVASAPSWEGLSEPNFRVVFLLFGLWIANAILTLVGTYVDKSGQTILLSLSATIVEMVLVILIIRQFHLLDHLAIRRLAMAGGVGQCVEWIVAIVYLYLLFRDVPSGIPQKDFLALPYANWTVAGSVGWRILAGAIGFWVTRNRWRKEKAG